MPIFEIENIEKLKKLKINDCLHLTMPLFYYFFVIKTSEEKLCLSLLTHWAALSHQIKPVAVWKNFPLGYIHSTTLTLKHLVCDIFHKSIHVSKKTLTFSLKNGCTNIPLANIDDPNFQHSKWFTNLHTCFKIMKLQISLAYLLGLPSLSYVSIVAWKSLSISSKLSNLILSMLFSFLHFKF